MTPSVACKNCRDSKIFLIFPYTLVGLNRYPVNWGGRSLGHMMYWNKIASCWNIWNVTLGAINRIIIRGETLQNKEGEFLKHFSEFGWAHLIDLPAGSTPLSIIHHRHCYEIVLYLFSIICLIHFIVR